MKPKHILIFVIANFILLGGVFSFGISPGLDSVARLAGTVRRQEGQLAYRSGLALEYERNLQLLQELDESRAFLLDEHEVNLEFAKIGELAEANNLQIINFAFGDQTGILTADGQHITRTNGRILGYGAVDDIINFLHGLEDTFANVMTADMVWREGNMARINIELTLFSVNI